MVDPEGAGFGTEELPGVLLSVGAVEEGDPAGENVEEEDIEENNVAEVALEDDVSEEDITEIAVGDLSTKQ